MSLAASARSSVLWNAGFNILNLGLQFAITTVLTRLLPQEAYGHFTFVTSVIGFISIFAMTNFIIHTLQVKDDSEVQWQDHFTAAVALNIGAVVLMNLVALALRAFPKWSSAAPLVHTLSLGFLLNCPAEFRRKMLERSFDWKKLRGLQAVGLLGSGIMAVTMGLTGCGTYSLLIPSLVPSLPFIYDLFVKEGWRPTWQWSRDYFKPAWRFGVGRIGSGIAYNGKQMLESMIYSGSLSFAALGVLSRSTGLAQMFCIQVATQILGALYPLLTRVNDQDGNGARVGSLVVQTVGWMAIPTAGAFIISAAPLVHLVYGKNWDEVTPLLPWSMTWGVLFALHFAIYHLLLARNQQVKCLRSDFLNLGLTAASLFWILPHGTMAYLQAVTALHFVILLLETYWLQQTDGITIRGWFAPLSSAIIAASGAAICSVGTLWAAGYKGTTALLPCMSASVLFCLTYVLLLRWVFTKQLDDWLHYLPMQGLLRQILRLK